MAEPVYAFNSRLARLPDRFPVDEWLRVDVDPIDDLISGERTIWAHRVDRTPHNGPFNEAVIRFERSLDEAAEKNARPRERVDERRTERRAAFDAKLAALAARNLPPSEFPRAREDAPVIELRPRNTPTDHRPPEHEVNMSSSIRVYTDRTMVAPGLSRFSGGGWIIDMDSIVSWTNYGWFALCTNQSGAVYACDVRTRQIRGARIDSRAVMYGAKFPA